MPHDQIFVAQRQVHFSDLRNNQDANGGELGRPLSEEK
jgi:hypothetical protein